TYPLSLHDALPISQHLGHGPTIRCPVPSLLPVSTGNPLPLLILPSFRATALKQGLAHPPTALAAPPGHSAMMRRRALFSPVTEHCSPISVSRIACVRTRFKHSRRCRNAASPSRSCQATTRPMLKPWPRVLALPLTARAFCRATRPPAWQNLP